VGIDQAWGEYAISGVEGNRNVACRCGKFRKSAYSFNSIVVDKKRSVEDNAELVLR
jgi:hypothetical protein